MNTELWCCDKMLVWCRDFQHEGGGGGGLGVLGYPRVLETLLNGWAGSEIMEPGIRITAMTP